MTASGCKRPVDVVSIATSSLAKGNVPSSAGQLSEDRHNGLSVLDNNTKSYRCRAGLSATESTNASGSARLNELAHATKAVPSKMSARRFNGRNP